MYDNIIKGYIYRFPFIIKKANFNKNNIEINFINNNQTNSIEGTIIINQETEEQEIIIFETKIDKTDDLLIFRTKYQSNGRMFEETDTFALIETMPYEYSTRKTKLLIHIVDGKIINAYQTGKKYKFENGIHENLSQLNLNNKEVIYFLNNIYPNNNKKR